MGGLLEPARLILPRETGGTIAAWPQTAILQTHIARAGKALAQGRPRRYQWRPARVRFDMTLPVTPDMIAAADDRIAPYIRRTPLLRPGAGAFGLDMDLTLKLELLQHAGSFKPRGAFYNLLTRPAPKAGVAAASGGNHGAAVAYAAKALGLPARIFVPEISSPAKVAAIRHFGAEAVVGGARYNDALAACETYMAESGALGVHAFDAIETITGQGTVALEWQRQAETLPDTVLIATGGGGLVAGMAAWWAGKVKVVA
ncbi:MAG: pyridoxal-phosphate dependent enzyme, partial [Beijerinckiaceae bacterium]